MRAHWQEVGVELGEPDRAGFAGQRMLPAADRAEIDDLLARYCFTLDLRDWDGLRHVFAPDAVITYSGSRTSAGIDDIVKFFRVTASAAAATQHLLHTSRVWATGARTAAGLAHVTAHHLARGAARPTDEASTYTVTGTYADDFTLTTAGWRISRRILTLLTKAGDPAILARPASGLPTGPLPLMNDLVTLRYRCPGRRRRRNP